LKRFMLLYAIILLIFFISYPVCGNAQETSAGQTIGGIAADVFVDNAGFTEKEKETIRRFYRGPNTSEDDWRNAENNASNYNWDPVDKDDDTSVSGNGKKHKNKKKGKKGMPPGLAKKDKLPPGLQKQLEKNGTLPPGLAKRDLPRDLVKQLPVRPNTHETTVVNEDIVLLEKATGRILDILYGGARRE